MNDLLLGEINLRRFFSNAIFQVKDLISNHYLKDFVMVKREWNRNE